jgi:hypothetical protein
MFGRRQRDSIVAGLSATQLMCVGATLLVFIPSMYVGQLPLVMMTAVLWVPPLVLAFVPLHGRKAVDWLPVVRDYVGRKYTGQTTYRAATSRPRPAGTLALPGRAAALRQYVHDPTGAVMIHDPHERTLTVTARIIPGAWTLAEPAEQDRRAEAWGSILASFCSRNTGIARIQILERTLPESGVAAEQYWAQYGRDDGSWESESYKTLLQSAAPASEQHESLISLTLEMRRSAAKIRNAGGGVPGAAELLAQEMKLLTTRLANMDVRLHRYLGEADLAEVLRGAYDPGALPMMARHPRRWP